MANELWRRGAGQLAELIRTRRVTSREVVDSHLARIDAVNPTLNAVVRVMADEARAGAAEADRAVERGDQLGPLHGVPFTIKENIDVAGTPTTNSLPAFADAVAGSDAPAVERMRAAGGIPIGRTNLPDLGLRVHTMSSLHGLTRNPWHAERTAGGSSGGEGAALAAGMSPIGLGNDIGGSLRNPAHCNGIASLKPTAGRVPFATEIPPLDPTLAAQFMVVEGPMARTIADVRLGLTIIAGAHPRDPKAMPVPLDATSVPDRLRVAVLPEPPGGTTDAGIAAVIDSMTAVFSAAGHTVVAAAPPMYQEAIDVWGRILIADLRAMRELLDMVMGEDARTFLDAADSHYPDLTLADVLAAYTQRHQIARAWASFFADVDVLISPVWTQPAFAHGWDTAEPANGAKVLELIRPVLPANVLGLPAAVVAGGMSQSMPVGVQVIGAPWSDLTCLAAAEVIEDAIGVLTPIDPSHELS